MKTTKKFFRPVEKHNGNILWNRVHEISTMDKAYDKTPATREYFTKRNLFTKSLNIEDISTVFDILEKEVFTLKHTTRD